MGLFIKCEEAQQICDKSQYKETSFFQKIIHFFHLAICKFCRTYTKSNTQLTKSLHDSRLRTLNSEEKRALQDKIQQNLSAE
ncbi:hypothetical protein [Aequorivita echinoideorum]|uniref:Glycine dehydrogenase n=1 Tax=Aequorivita echinoideorum TaxID=1549647 RepID=A0ABS5S2N5_9FLAO|nr:hypothetical protein [Aequorivita echinoideorum]MBT0607471.1 hypothetical protein [Aequorivita echinoideorum]